jgi:hypothetical protein
MEPSGAGDYVLLRRGRLEQWDSDGFIRAFRRVGKPADAPQPAERKKAASPEPAARHANLSVQAKPLSNNKVELIVESDLPHPVLLSGEASLHGQRSEDIYIGYFERLRLDSSRQTFVLDASKEGKDLPNGDYDVIVQFNPAWAAEPDASPLLSEFTRKITDATRVRLTDGKISAKEADARNRARYWLMTTFYADMPWKESKFVQHLGRYELIPAEWGHHKGYYFPKADMTVLVNLLTKTASAYRDGKPSQ